MEIRTCGTCGGHWVNDQFYWAMGKEGSELDLAGLVCNSLSPEKRCINPCRGEVGGQTWESRRKEVDKALERGGL
jgi:hypothetical protein